MLNIACHSWGFNDRPLDEALGTIARLGFRAAALGSGPHLDVGAAVSSPRAAAAGVQTLLRRYGLALADVTLLLPRIAHPDAAQRERDVAVFRALVPFLEALAPHTLTLSPGVARGTPQALAQARTRAAECLREMHTLAERAGLVLAVEPHLDSPAPTPEAARALAAAVPGLALTVDVAHLVCGGASVEAVLALLPGARQVQVRGATPGRLQVPLAQSSIDVAALGQTLTTGGFGGWVTVELLQTTTWQGLVRVSSVHEAVALRDALLAHVRAG